jgi:hypothetical protein
MIKLTKKEIKRQSDDGFVIISRPAKLWGGYHVLCVRVETGMPVGWEEYVKDKADIARAATRIQRDLDKFLGRGGKMSSKGRLRPGIKQNKAREVQCVSKTM